MAIEYGAVSGHERVGIDIVQTPATVLSTTTSVQIDFHFYVRSEAWGFNDDQHLETGVHVSGGFDYNLYAATGATVEKYVGTKTLYITPTYGATVTRTASGAVSGQVFGGTPNHTRSVVVAARPYAVPTAPGQPGMTALLTTSATATWTPPSDWGGNATGTYYVHIDDASDFSSPVASTVSAASASFTGLLPNTTYYMRTRGYNVAGPGAWSATRSFTTGAAVPSACGLPAMSGITTTGATATWAEPSNWGGDDTDTYDVQIDDNIGFASPTTVPTAATTYGFTGLSPNTVYYVKARGKNAGGNGAWSSVQTFTTATAIPTAPGQPSATSITTSSVSSTWTAPSNWGGSVTNQYDLQVSTYAGFTAPTTIPLTANTHTVTGLSPNVTYYLRSRAKNAGGPGPWSTPRTFTTLAAATTAPGDPVITDVDVDSVTATWALPVSYGGSPITSYNFQRSLSPAFTSPTVITGNLDRTCPVPGLTPYTTYYVRVQAVNAGGNSAWSGTVAFTTLSGGQVVTAGGVLVPGVVQVVAPGGVLVQGTAWVFDGTTLVPGF